ncbi:MAG TPA: GMC oxidoreductase [Acidimicrobiales bacterium]|nr:GMC oxidoreductase [Acidimicrobiales bacterium]
MPTDPMSSSVDELRAEYSVVIVGSGYGGSVLAARLSEEAVRRSEAGEGDLWPKGICLFERGLELHPGEYPDRLTNAPRHIQISTERWSLGSKSALFDFRFGRDVNVLVGCGLGGGSLINAGVSLRAPVSAFAKGWPTGIDQAELDPYYDRAAKMLLPRPYSGPELAKFRALDRSAIALRRRAEKAPINVTFSARPSGPAGPGPGGGIQPPCTSCGDCVSGCNVGAKNTLLMNYLPIAHRNGVQMFTRTGVRELEEGTGKYRGRWLVYVDRSAERRRRSPCNFVVADIVILAGGTLGSTEILMRSRELGLTVSDRLGDQFSANGDVLGFAFDGRSPVDAIAGDMRGVRHTTVGPTITGMAEVDWPGDDGTKRILLEEGAIPGVLAPLLPLAFAGGAVRRRRWRLLKALSGPYAGALHRTLPYLLIYPDDGGGRLTLQGDHLQVDWRDHPGRPAYRAHKELLREAASDGLGATLYREPGVDGISSPLTTVHPLGGCAMADDAQHGVVDADGRVFNGSTGNKIHDGLYVCDGSVIPVALGVNPLLTIAALAERTAFRITGAGPKPAGPGAVSEKKPPTAAAAPKTKVARTAVGGKKGARAAVGPKKKAVGT